MVSKQDDGFQLTYSKLKKVYLLQRKNKRIYKGPVAGFAAARLLDAMINALALPSKHGLLFHASALVCKKKDILLPGDSGAGKTTLAAFFSSLGCNCLSDELVSVHANNLEGFQRPLHVKKSGIDTLSKTTGKALQPGKNGILKWAGLIGEARYF